MIAVPETCAEATGGPDAAEVSAVNEIRLTVFAQLDHQIRWRRSRHIHQQRAGATQIDIAIVELKPVGRHPVIAGIAGKNWAWLKTNHRFAPAPCAARIEGVTRGNEWIAS